MRIVYMYHTDEPKHGSVIPGSLPNPQLAYKGYIPLSLTQRPTQHHDEIQRISTATSATVDPALKVHHIELRNQDVKLPLGDDTFYWCNVFEMEMFQQKQHLIRVSFVVFFFLLVLFLWFFFPIYRIYVCL